MSKKNEKEFLVRTELVVVAESEEQAEDYAREFWGENPFAMDIDVIEIQED